jgi:transcriptional regulator with XRE-family HTH domain
MIASSSATGSFSTAFRQPSSPAAQGATNAQTIATNVRRLMAREGLTFSDVVAATGLDERTVRGLVRGTNNPHARTLHKFASGLGLAIDELFQPVGRSARQAFDRATNPAVGGLIENVAQQNGDLFAAWSDVDFDELYSQFGAGGALNEAGVVAAAEAINAKRALLRKVAVILESSEAELLADFVKLLYRRVTVSVPSVDGTPTPTSS